MASPLTVYASIDNCIANAGDATTNFGTATYLIIYESAATSLYHVILRFDFSALPVGSIITSAILSLYKYNSGFGPEGRTYDIFRMLRTDWVETESTWNIYKTSNNWGTAGCINTTSDITTSNSSSAIVPANNNWMDFTVTDMVKDVQGVGIINTMIKGHLEDAYGISDFYSREQGGLTVPKLVITYTTPPPGGLFTFNG